MMTISQVEELIYREGGLDVPRLTDIARIALCSRGDDPDSVVDQLRRNMPTLWGPPRRNSKYGAR